MRSAYRAHDIPAARTSSTALHVHLAAACHAWLAASAFLLKEVVAAAAPGLLLNLHSLRRAPLPRFQRSTPARKQGQQLRIASTAWTRNQISASNSHAKSYGAPRSQ